LTSDEVWGAQALQSAWWLDEVIMGNGGEIFLGEFRRDLEGMTANYDSEIAVSTYKYFSDLINEHQVAFPAGEFEGMGSPFMTGKVGMVYDLNWGPLTYKDAPFDWDLTKVPTGSVDQLTYGGADGLVVSQATQALDTSWKLINWLIDPATGGAFLTDSGAMPVLKTDEVTQGYLQTFPDKNMQALVDSAAIARNTYTLGFNEWKTALQDELDEAFLGQKPVEQMCIDANIAVNNALDRIRNEFAEAIGG
jgi:maltose-binding protein MalE